MRFRPVILRAREAGISRSRCLSEGLRAAVVLAARSPDSELQGVGERAEVDAGGGAAREGGGRRGGWGGPYKKHGFFLCTPLYSPAPKEV